MKAMKITNQDSGGGKQKGMQKELGFMFLGALVTAYVFARLVSLMGLTTLGQGVQLGFWIWLGFIVTVLSGGVLFEKRSTTLYFINSAYYLVTLLVMGAVLAVWY